MFWPDGFCFASCHCCAPRAGGVGILLLLGSLTIVSVHPAVAALPTAARVPEFVHQGRCAALLGLLGIFPTAVKAGPLRDLFAAAGFGHAAFGGAQRHTNGGSVMFSCRYWSSM